MKNLSDFPLVLGSLLSFGFLLTTQILKPFGLKTLIKICVHQLIAQL